MSDAICVRDITSCGPNGSKHWHCCMYVPISPSKCVTSLIKIPRDLLSRTEGEFKRERESECERVSVKEWVWKSECERVTAREWVWEREWLMGWRGEWEEARHSAGYVTFDSRSKYSIRDEISRLPSPTIITGRRCTGCCTQLPLCGPFFTLLYISILAEEMIRKREKKERRREQRVT